MTIAFRSNAGISKLLVNSLTSLFAIVPLDTYSQVTESGQAAVSAPKPVDSSTSLPTSGDPVEASSPVTMLSTVVVTAPKSDDAPLGASGLGDADLLSQRAVVGDSARLLQDLPGVSLYGAGGISSLPVIHGLADDRLRVQVDGMDPMSACPNHMNSALSYINPTKVGSVTVFAGISPVSAGGDSIGGTIQVNSTPPAFAKAGGGVLIKGEAGAFYHSNGDAHGFNFGATLAGRNANLSYSESSAQSDNYAAGRSFKAPGIGSILPGGEWLDGDEVGSSAYKASINKELAFALRHEGHLLQLSVSEQTVGFEGFPNQRMDMTANKNTLVNLRYTGAYEWGELEARIFDQNTQHKMDMGPDRFSYGYGMPMDTKAKTRGALITGSIELSERDTLRLGSEYQAYDLDDWWPPVGVSGSMCCDAFWNVSDGKRDRLGFFGEWEARWNPQWLSQIGIRTDTVRANAGDVQGYSTAGIWSVDAANFNVLDRQRTDHHWDLTALARYEPDETRTFEAGYARKTRSPNLYERYPWSTQAMAALMNNFVGDGNGYIGNPDLKPEVANTLSVTGDWHDADKNKWGLKATTYYTYVDDFIDAQRCDFGQCSASNVTRTTGFVLLQYVNDSARLYGVDVSGHVLLGRTTDYGSFTTTGVLNYVRGENRTTGDDLYHIMPINAKLALVQNLGSWANTAEVQLVAAKKHVSQVRDEVPTDGYGLLNLRSSYEWKQARLDVGIENVLNRFYSLPLGGAYVGQGMSMSTNTIPWGVTVPGMGRSINASLNVHF
ncbi:MAG: TonB-dependent receptor [Thiobacillaceae bacterium]